MKNNYLKRLLYIGIPVVIVAFLIITVSLTFGDSDAGIGLGVFEGVLVILIGLLVVFSKPVGRFFSKYITGPIKARRNKTVKTEETTVK